jgi:hypothetical protein
MVRALTGDSINRLNEPIHMGMKIPAAVDFRGIAITECAQAPGKLFMGRHDGAIDQDRNDGDISLERHFDLDADYIPPFMDPAFMDRSSSRSFLDPEPSWPNHDNQDPDLGPDLLNIFAKIDPEGDAVDVDEYGLLAVPSGQPVCDATRNRR